MENVQTDSLDSKGVKGTYAELSSLFFEGLPLKPNKHFMDVKIVSIVHEKSTRTVIQECLRMNMINSKTVIQSKEIENRLTYERLSSCLEEFLDKGVPKMTAERDLS